MTQEKQMNHAGADRDWGELIRTELDSYVPERLPARFSPRPTLPRQHPSRPGWRFVAIALAVFMLGFIASDLIRGSSPIYVYPAPAPVREVGPSPQTAPSSTPVQTPQPTASATAPATSGPAPGSPPAATTAPRPAPTSAPAATSAPQSAPAQTPAPTTGTCLLGAVCVGLKPP